MCLTFKRLSVNPTYMYWYDDPNQDPCVYWFRLFSVCLRCSNSFVSAFTIPTLSVCLRFDFEYVPSFFRLFGLGRLPIEFAGPRTPDYQVTLSMCYTWPHSPKPVILRRASR